MGSTTKFLKKKEIKTGISRNKRVASSRLFIASGIISPILYVTTFTIDGLLHPGYSPLHQTISSLSVGAYGWIQNTNAIVCGILLIIFAFAFFQMMYRLIDKKWLMISLSFLHFVGLD